MNPFTFHPSEVGESYAGHAAAAAGFGIRLCLAGVACLVHALLPFLFVRTGSHTVVRLHRDMVSNRRNFRHRHGPMNEMDADRRP